LGDWDNPYLTMARGNEADEIRVPGKLLEKGYVYRGLKPVNWCFDCGSALAEAEVEYEDRKDPAIDVAFEVDPQDREKLLRAFSVGNDPGSKPIFAVIWTTTPWTIPGNQALNVHPEFTYHLVDTEKGCLILAAELQEACLARYKLAGKAPASGKGAALEHLRFRHPFSDREAPVDTETGGLSLAAGLQEACLARYKLAGKALASCKGAALEHLRFRHPFYDREAPVYLGDYVTLDTGTGIVHSAPAYGVEDFESC